MLQRHNRFVTEREGAMRSLQAFFTARLDVSLIPAMTNISVVGFLSVLCLAAGAQAQQPTDAQRNAVRSACRSDFIAQCSGVTPGGMEALTCLQQHNASLSKPCREAISNLEGPKKSSNEAPPQSDVTPPTTTAAAAQKQPTAAQRDAVKSSCRSDFMTQCSGVTPGGRRHLPVCSNTAQRSRHHARPRSARLVETGQPT